MPLVLLLHVLPLQSAAASRCRHRMWSALPPPHSDRSPPPLPQPYPMHQPMNMAGMNGYAEPMAPRYNSSGSLPSFTNLPGFSQAGLTTQASAGLAMPAAPPAYMAAPPAQPAFPAALAAALNAADSRLAPAMPSGASSPFSTLDAQGHPSTASSPPKHELQGLPAGLPLAQHRSISSGSSGSASPDLDAAAGAQHGGRWGLWCGCSGRLGWAAPAGASCAPTLPPPAAPCPTHLR